MIANNLAHRRASLGFAVLAAAALLVFAALGSGRADAQSICDQYPNLPECQDPDRDDDDDDGDGDRRDEAGAGAGGPSADAGAADGELPFTGYPLTPLLLLFLALLLAGLAIRAYLAARDRLAGRGSHTPLQ